MRAALRYERWNCSPQLASALSILGYIRAIYDRDWVGAEADLVRAMQLDPNDTATVWSLAHVYSLLGRHDEAIQLTQNFADRYPKIGRHHSQVAGRLIDAGRYADAIDKLELALEYNAEPAQIADTRGVALVGLQRFDEALKEFEFAVDAKQRNAGTVARLAYVYGVLGQTDAASALIEELEDRSGRERISVLALATAYVGQGNDRRAMDYLRQAVSGGGREALSIANDHFFARLQANPEFREIVASLQLPSR